VLLNLEKLGQLVIGHARCGKRLADRFQRLIRPPRQFREIGGR
jgi:hypothetical protein